MGRWFFVLDHSNYARWIPIHINLRDMKALSAQAKEQLAFMGYTKITEKIFLHAY